VLQLYYDLARLWHKSVVLSTLASPGFVAGPAVAWVAVTGAALLVPLGPAGVALSFRGDVLLFIYLLAVARFCTAWAALETGSAFEGMGAAREVTFACLAEPALFFALLALARLSGSLTLTGLLHGPSHVAFGGVAAPLVLIAIGLFIVLLAENCRIPVDDPNTHLELTMIHEVMVLDHSGPLFGLILYGAAVKLFLFGTLFLHVVAPVHCGPAWADALLFVAEILGLAAVVGVVESVMARLQMRHVPYLLVAAVLFCGFGLVLLVR
jgi:formate hydrogenlyase subunit 4